jgi:cysteine synthase
MTLLDATSGNTGRLCHARAARGYRVKLRPQNVSPERLAILGAPWG